MGVCVGGRTGHVFGAFPAPKVAAATGVRWRKGGLAGAAEAALREPPRAALSPSGEPRATGGGRVAHKVESRWGEMRIGRLVCISRGKC